MKQIKRFGRFLRRKAKQVLGVNSDFGINEASAMNALYKILYTQIHDWNQAYELPGCKTSESFRKQWEQLPEGQYLLSDQKFKNCVDSILAEHELLLPKSWFKSKKVLDAGCGNGRWSYGFSRLGVDLTSVDINSVALQYTEAAAAEYDNPKRFIQTPLENLLDHVQENSFDLVFCWGVAHHCPSFVKVMNNLVAACKEGGVVYLYLYGKDSISETAEMELFKQRIIYNVLLNDEEKMLFLMQKANGDKDAIHLIHDVYAPLINRRFTFDEIKGFLESLGCRNFVRTINHTEVFIRATKGESAVPLPTLAGKKSPFWFMGAYND